MSLNTLETSYVNGQVIDASHINELTLSLLGALVGRDANGVPTPAQSLGTLAIPWGNLYATGIILNGLALDTSNIVSLPNRVVSGQTRSLSSMPDFLRADGVALAFDIEAAATDLVLSINNAAVSVTSDITVSSVTAAPSTNNTCDVNDTTIVADLYAGEEEYDIPEITIDDVGTEISSRVGQVAAFLTPNGEIFQALIKDATTLSNVYRGFYFDDTGAPIERAALDNNDSLTLLNIGWVFIEDNGTTVDVSYVTPTIAYSAPTSPVTGQYWFDISNQVWKRYSGTSFEIIDRILIGQVVASSTAVVATRSIDFNKPYSEKNTAEIEIFSSEIAKTKSEKSEISVYGTSVYFDLSKLQWNITTDLETGLIEASDTLYFLYLSDEGRPIISDQRPYKRDDLNGYYHPYESYRCLGTVYNDSSDDFSESHSVKPFFRNEYWRIQEGIEIGATTTAPTKGSTDYDRWVWKREGKDLIANLQYLANSAGTNGSGDYLFKIPDVIPEMDLDLVQAYSDIEGWNTGIVIPSSIGTASSGYGGETTTSVLSQVVPYDSRTFRIGGITPSTSGYLGSGALVFNQSSTYISANIRVPIKGWE